MKVLIINPGSTSTKIAVYDEETPVFSTTVEHDPETLTALGHIVNQADYREELIRRALTDAGYAPADFDAVCGRGGLFKAIPSGTYLVDEDVLETIRTAPFGEHASNLGSLLAKRIADSAGLPAFFVDPVSVDEMTEVAHVTGFAPMRRVSQFHCLNQKGMGRRAAETLGKSYEECNLIVCHLGGGVSIGAHCKGRVVDCTNVLNDGGMGMDRGGGLPVQQVVDFCFDSGLTRAEAKATFSRRAGMLSYLGTTDMREVEKRVREGDEEAILAYEALIYQLCKDIGALAAVLHFEVDGIVLTGGIAHNTMLCDKIQDYVGRLAPVLRMPGEAEMLSLAQGALRVLHGEPARKY